MIQVPDCEACVSLADGLAEPAHSAAARERPTAAGYWLLADSVAAEGCDQAREGQCIGFSARQRRSLAPRARPAGCFPTRSIV